MVLAAFTVDKSRTTRCGCAAFKAPPPACDSGPDLLTALLQDCLVVPFIQLFRKEVHRLDTSSCTTCPPTALHMAPVTSPLAGNRSASLSSSSSFASAKHGPSSARSAPNQRPAHGFVGDPCARSLPLDMPLRKVISAVVSSSEVRSPSPPLPLSSSPPLPLSLSHHCQCHHPLRLAPARIGMRDRALPASPTTCTFAHVEPPLCPRRP